MTNCLFLTGSQAKKHLTTHLNTGDFIIITGDTGLESSLMVIGHDILKSSGREKLPSSTQVQLRSSSGPASSSATPKTRPHSVARTCAVGLIMQFK